MGNLLFLDISWEEKTLRGIHSVVDDIRRNVFTEVARLAYEGGDYSRIDLLPYKIVPGEEARYRHDIFLGHCH